MTLIRCKGSVTGVDRHIWVGSALFALLTGNIDTKVNNMIVEYGERGVGVIKEAKLVEQGKFLLPLIIGRVYKGWLSRNNVERKRVEERYGNL